MAKLIPEETQRAARSALNFLSQFGCPAGAWTIVVGKKAIEVRPDEARMFLEANIHNKGGVRLSVKDLQYTRHLAIETHRENITCFPARAMAAVRVGRNVSFLYRFVNQVDLKRAHELARMAIDVIGGSDLEFLFPLPGSIRHGLTVELKRVTPDLISWPTQFIAASAEKKKAVTTPVDAKGSALLDALHSFNIEAEIASISRGPSFTLYEVTLPRGTKATAIVSLADDLASALGVEAVRVDTVTGRNTIGIELPNEKRETVSLPKILESDAFLRTSAVLPLALGKAINGAPVVVDLQKMPHLMIAGTTGSGKSVGLKSMILSLMARLAPDDLGFILIDPKQLDLTPFENIPHLALPIITDPDHAIQALGRIIEEMETRYSIMRRAGVDGIAEFNAQARASERFRYFVVIIDELADLMLQVGKELDAAVRRLSGKARAAGIHLILATQRPDATVITGTIKANMAERIAFRVLTAIDSRVIFGDTSRAGAEQLLGEGDMLYMAAGARLKRVQGAFASNREVREMAAQYSRGHTPVNRGTAFDAPLLPHPQKMVSLSAAAVTTTKPQKTETARQALARVLKTGIWTTTMITAKTGISRQRLQDLRRDGFLVSSMVADGRELVWSLA